MSEEEDIPITFKPGTLSGESEASVDKADPQVYSENLLGQKFIEKATGLAKDRRYIDDPSDAPDDVDIEEGPQGGQYYEVGGTEEEGGEEPTEGDDGDGESPVSSPEAAEVWDDIVSEYGSPQGIGEAAHGEPERAASLAEEAVETYAPDDMPEEAYNELMTEFTEEARDVAEELTSESDRIHSEITDEMDSGPVALDTENGEYNVDVSYIDEDLTPTSTSDFIVYGTNDNGDKVGIPSEDIRGVGESDGGETLWEAELATNYNEGDEVTVDTERVGEIEGHIPEGGLDFLEYDELIIEDTQGTEHSIPTEEIQGLEPQDKSEKGGDPKDEDVQEAAAYLAQELGGDVEPGDVIDAVQTHRRIQPDDQEEETGERNEPPRGDSEHTPGPGGEAAY